MQRLFFPTLALALLITTASFGQSLGDVARANRDKQNTPDAASAAKPKVLTNRDLPKDPDASESPAGADAAANTGDAEGVPVEHHSSEHRLAQQRSAQQRVAEQWKRQIVAQKNKMAALQARIDQIQASIQSANGSVHYEGPTSRYQAQQLQRVAQIQQQLDEQERKLEQMQEAARHAGMHTVVYDP
jgi:hypothetical protein